MIAPNLIKNNQNTIDLQTKQIYNNKEIRKSGVCRLLHKGGDVYGRNNFIRYNQFTILWISINSYHNICLNYCVSSNYKQRKIKQKYTLACRSSVFLHKSNGDHFCGSLFQYNYNIFAHFVNKNIINFIKGEKYENNTRD